LSSEVFLDSLFRSIKTSSIDDHNKDKENWKWHSEPNNEGGALYALKNTKEYDDPTSKGGKKSVGGEHGFITSLILCAATRGDETDDVDSEELFCSRLD